MPFFVVLVWQCLSFHRDRIVCVRLFLLVVEQATLQEIVSNRGALGHSARTCGWGQLSIGN